MKRRTRGQKTMVRMRKKKRRKAETEERKTKEKTRDKVPTALNPCWEKTERERERERKREGVCGWSRLDTSISGPESVIKARHL